LLPDGKKSCDVLVAKRQKRSMKEKGCQTPKFLIENMVADEYRANKHGKITPKSWLKKRAKSTDDITVLTTTDDEGSDLKAAGKKLKGTASRVVV
jgi:hypothetical protein